MSIVLIVDENELNVDMLGRRLRRRGFEIRTASNGEEALESVRRAAPDVILMDMSMPVMDGWTATARLKSDPATRDIPVIALTASAMESDRTRALEVGCDAFDTKPVDLDRLLGKMVEVMTASRGAGDGAA